jgi:hypothetical protein
MYALHLFGSSSLQLQMTVPFIPFMLKEITLKCSLAYNDDEFKDTVDAFIAGE